jgi:hypothetical protein
MTAKFKELKHKIATISMWTFLKWVFLTIFVFYVGYSIVRDFSGLKVDFQVYYNHDGMLKPVLAK